MINCPTNIIAIYGLNYVLQLFTEIKNTDWVAAPACIHSHNYSHNTKAVNRSSPATIFFPLDGTTSLEVGFIHRSSYHLILSHLMLRELLARWFIFCLPHSAWLNSTEKNMPALIIILLGRPPPKGEVTKQDRTWTLYTPTCSCNISHKRKLIRNTFGNSH